MTVLPECSCFSSREKSGAGLSSCTFAATFVRTRVSASLACL